MEGRWRRSRAVPARWMRSGSNSAKTDCREGQAIALTEERNAS